MRAEDESVVVAEVVLVREELAILGEQADAGVVSLSADRGVVTRAVDALAVRGTIVDGTDTHVVRAAERPRKERSAGPAVVVARALGFARVDEKAACAQGRTGRSGNYCGAENAQDSIVRHWLRPIVAAAQHDVKIDARAVRVLSIAACNVSNIDAKIGLASFVHKTEIGQMHTSKFIGVLVRVASLNCAILGIFAACSAACSDSTSGSVTPTDAGKAAEASAETGPAASDVAIALQVTYAGTQTGPVLASVWPTPMPGVGTPAGAGSNESPTLPGTNLINIKNVNPGHYFVFSYIMVGAEHRTGPAGADPSGPPVEVDVVAGEKATASATVFDPQPSDAGDAGDSG